MINSVPRHLIRSRNVGVRGASGAAVAATVISGSNATPTLMGGVLSSSDIGAFHAHIERLGIPSRAEELAVLSIASAAVAREADAMATPARALTHLLLSRESVSFDDLADPAASWLRGGGGGGGGRRGEETSDSSSSLLDVEGGGRGGGTTSSSSSSQQQLQQSQSSEFLAMAAFEGSADVTTKISAVGSEGIAERDNSPLIGGALSRVSSGELAPRPAGEDIEPNPVSLAYIDAVCNVLTVNVLARLDGVIKTHMTPLSNEALIALRALASTPSGEDLPTPITAWIASQSPANIATLSSAAAAAALGAGMGGMAQARLEAVTALLTILRKAQAGRLNQVEGSEGPRSLPSTRALHKALSAATDAHARSATAPLREWASTASAAAAAAATVRSRAVAAGEALSGAAMQALRARAAAAAAAGGDAIAAARSEPPITVLIPEVLDIIASPGLEIQSLTVIEGGKRQFHLATGPRGGSLHARLAAGHVPAMLSPLMWLLTPSEWSAVLTAARTTLPSLSPYLSPAVSLPTSFFTSAAVRQTNALAAADIGGTYAVLGRDTHGNSFVNPTGVATSDLNVLVPYLGGSSAGGTPSGRQRAAAIRATADAAPSPASRDEYLAYVLRARAARVLLVSQKAAQNEAKESLASAAAAATAAGDETRALAIAAAAANLDNAIAMLAAGERVADESAVLTALRRAEAALGPLNTNSSPAIAAHKALRALVGDARIGTGVTAFSTAAAATAPSAGGSRASARVAAPEIAIARLDWGLGSVNEPRVHRDGGAARVSAPFAAALARWDTSSSSLPTALGQEDSGGIDDVDGAYVTHALLEDGVWPPLPRLLPWDLSWAARRAATGWPSSDDCGLSVRNAAVGAPIQIRAYITTLEHSSPSSSAFAAADVPAVSINAAGDGTGIQNLPNAARVARLTVAEAALEEGGGDNDDRVGSGGSGLPTDAFVPPIDYRAPSSHTLLHYRMLEAVAALDLGAAWGLWAESCRTHPQTAPEGNPAPDVLAVEILLDAAGRARRPDLVFNVLWPRLMAWRVAPTSEMWFLLIKAAALSGDASTACALLDGARTRGLPIDARAHSAVVSVLTETGRWRDAFAALETMRRSGFQPDAQVWCTFLARLAVARRAEDAHYVWRALAATPALALSANVYTSILQSLSSLGLVEDVEEAVKRMGRKRDGGQRPTLEGGAAVFAAYIAADKHEAAAAMVDDMDSRGLFSAPNSNATRAQFDAILGKSEKGGRSSSTGTTSTSSRSRISGNSSTARQQQQQQRLGSSSSTALRSGSSDETSTKSALNDILDASAGASVIFAAAAAVPAVGVEDDVIGGGVTIDDDTEQLPFDAAAIRRSSSPRKRT